MTDFGDVFMRELQSCKFAVVDGDKKQIRAYAKKKRLNSDYNIKTFRNEKYTKIWFYKPWQKMSADKAEKVDIGCLYNSQGLSFRQYQWLCDKTLVEETRPKSKMSSPKVEVPDDKIKISLVKKNCLLSST